jgi:hypothetical protein
MEVLTFVGSGLMGSAMTIWDKMITQRGDMFKQRLEGQVADDESAEKARKWSFPFARKTLLLTVCFTAFIWPVVAPVLWPDVAVTVGYTEMSRGFAWWAPKLETIWHTASEGNIVLTPLYTSVASAITGFLCGNQIVKS